MREILLAHNEKVSDALFRYGKNNLARAAVVILAANEDFAKAILREAAISASAAAMKANPGEGQDGDYNQGQVQAALDVRNALLSMCDLSEKPALAPQDFAYF